MIAVLVGMFLYAIIHSLMAGKTIKTAMRNRLGERAYYGLYRLVYNAIASISILPVLLWIYLGTNTVVWHVTGPLQTVFLAIQAVGVIGLGISLIQIDGAQFLGLSQLRAYLEGDPLPLPTEPLQTRGTYALVRHPLYLFSLLAIWPMVVMTDTLLAFNVVTTLYFVIGSRLEEQRLERIFGKEYVDYKRRVPWLLPIPRGR